MKASPAPGVQLQSELVGLGSELEEQGLSGLGLELLPWVCLEVVPKDRQNEKG